jgi:hypothetical protein
LQYAHDNGCPCGQWTSRNAALKGHLACLRYVHEKGCRWDSRTCEAAAENGRLLCLQYAHENGCNWDVMTCRVAAQYGHLPCLRYAHENGCHWDSWTSCLAARWGQLACLRYMHENGCSWDVRVCMPRKEYQWDRYRPCEDIRFERRFGSVGATLHQNIRPWDATACYRIANVDDLDCVRYMQRNGCIWNVRFCCLFAIRFGDFLLLKYAYQNRHYDADRFCHEATEFGNLQCLRYLRENGCPWDEKTCYKAAVRGHFEILRYARENGCPWDKTTCIAAAKKGCLEILKYAHENGCEWEATACYWAARNGHFVCLQFLYQNDCHWNEETCHVVGEDLAWLADNRGLRVTREQMKCLTYLFRNYRRWAGFGSRNGKNSLWRTKKREDPAIIREVMLDLMEERSRAATVIQRKWIEYICRPGCASAAMQNARRNFETLQESFDDHVANRSIS